MTSVYMTITKICVKFVKLEINAKTLIGKNAATKQGTAASHYLIKDLQVNDEISHFKCH